MSEREAESKRRNTPEPIDHPKEGTDMSDRKMILKARRHHLDTDVIELTFKTSRGHTWLFACVQEDLIDWMSYKDWKALGDEEMTLELREVEEEANEAG